MATEEKENKDKENSQKSKPLNREKAEKLSKQIFWNMNFLIVYGFISKIIHSLGSNKLTTIIEKVCNDENTPASFLIKHGIFMWYNKNLQVDNIARKLDEDGFSETAKRIIKFMVVNHCSLHSTGFKEKQKIETKLQIPSQKLRNADKYCTKCGKPMKLVTRKGKGNIFWECSDYPKCKFHQRYHTGN